MVTRMDDQDVAALDPDPKFPLPLLKVLRPIDIVVAHAELLKINDTRRSDQRADGDPGNVRTGIVEVERRVEVRGDVVGTADVLGVHALEGHLLDPFDG